jgi:hypothetical protein
MKWLSISEFQSGFKSILRRFPVCFIISLVGVFCAVELAQFQDDAHHPVLLKLLIVCSLALPLLLSVQLIAERYELSAAMKVVLNALGIGLLTAYFFYLPVNMDYAPNFYYYRTELFWIALHLLVAFAPFISSSDINSFWEFNKRLFLRMFQGGLFSITLFIGITLALLALDKLFGVNVVDKRYFQAFIICVGLVNTNFFLAGVPRVKKDEPLESDYPKGLRIFTSYILMPLVIIYLCILYSYIGKIIITHSWPSGWVSYLVTYFSEASILAALLVWPIRQNKERPWVSLYSRLLFILLIPLSIMLSIAIYKRIHEYGITNERYFIVITAVWLFCISLFYIFKKFNNIKVIPISLSIIILIINIGPFSSFQLSKSNQLHRLTNLLEKNHVLQNGVIIPNNPANKTISDSIAYRITTIVEYICSDYGASTLQPFFKNAIIKDTMHEGHYLYNGNTTDTIMSMMGIKSVDYYPPIRGYRGGNDSARNATKNAAVILAFNSNLYNLKGYSYEIDEPFETNTTDTTQYIAFGDKYFYYYNDSLADFIIHSKSVFDTVNLYHIVDSLVLLHADSISHNNDYGQDLTFDSYELPFYIASSKTFQYKFIFCRIRCNYSVLTHKVSDITPSGTLLLNKRIYPDGYIKK